MARSELTAVREASEALNTWSLRRTSRRVHTLIKNRPRTKDEWEDFLKIKRGTFPPSEDDGQTIKTSSLPQNLQAELKSSPHASKSITPPRLLESGKPLSESAEASEKLDEVINENCNAEVDKIKADPLNSDRTTKTSPVTSSPISDISHLVGVNELVLEGSSGDVSLDSDQGSLECEEQPVATNSRSSTAEGPAKGLGPCGKIREEREKDMMRSAGRAPAADYVTSSDEEPDEVSFVDDYFISDDSDEMEIAPLLDMPYEGGDIVCDDPTATVFKLHGVADRVKRPFYQAVDQWKLQIVADCEPFIFVRLPPKPRRGGQPVQNDIWVRLVKPKKEYSKHLKIVLAAAYLVTFVKGHPGAPKTAAWKFVLKGTSHHDFKPALREQDLDKAAPLLQKLMSNDVKLSKSVVMKDILSTLRVGVSLEEKVAGGRGQASTSTGYTILKQRSTTNFSPSAKKRNVESATDSDGFANFIGEWADEPSVCMFCDDGVEPPDRLICCDGGCMRSFHPTQHSGRATNCLSLNLPKAVLKADGYICSNCKFKQHQCFACNKLGRSSKTSTAPQEVFCCSDNRCKRYYHLKCVYKLLGQKDDGSEKFYCPLHKCHECGLGQTKKEALVKCRRCPRAWHLKCSNYAKEDENLWKVEGGYYVHYCNHHKIDPDLNTPIRDHIIFPDGEAHQTDLAASSGRGLGKLNTSSKRYRATTGSPLL